MLQIGYTSVRRDRLLIHKLRLNNLLLTSNFNLGELTVSFNQDPIGKAWKLASRKIKRVEWKTLLLEPIFKKLQVETANRNITIFLLRKAAIERWKLVQIHDKVYVGFINSEPS